MPDFKNYTFRGLERPDHATLAAALTTIYKEGRESFPPNPRWDDDWWISYSLGYIPNDRSFITINASQGYSDMPDRFMIFSINTKYQAVLWKCGKLAPNATRVPELLQPFLRELTEKVHDIAANRAKALELKRERAEEERKEAERYYEANKEKIDAERELKRQKGAEEETKRKEEAARERLKEKLLSRKNELDHTFRVMKWKASAAERPPVEKPIGADKMLESANRVEKPSGADKMLESAKQGPNHDLCEECAGMLRFCAHKECINIGCLKCFSDDLRDCNFCTSIICVEHSDAFNNCSTCESLVCKPCGGQTCRLCEDFICNECSECRHCGIRVSEDCDFDDQHYDIDYYF